MSYLPPVVCVRAHVLFTLFCLFVFACAQCCLTNIVLFYCLVYLRLVCHVLSVSLDCPFSVAPSVFSNVICFRLKAMHYYIIVIIEYNEHGRIMFAVSVYNKREWYIHQT